jgi:hypothetical protein
MNIEVQNNKSQEHFLEQHKSCCKIFVDYI